MSRPPLDELYFEWLYSQVGSVIEKNPSRTYWKVLKQLYTKEFVWIVPNDDNRAEDGRYLRYEFLDYENLPSDYDWLRLGCSMFEMLIGLSRRLSFQDDGSPRGWFWHLMENLGLENCNDNSLIHEDKISKILDEVIWRTYRRNGAGGLFPLRRAHEDQTQVELWDQMHSYLREKA